MRIQLPLMMLLCLCVTASAAADHSGWIKSYAAKFIKKNDGNNDGKLNADEYPQRYQKYFGNTDKNNDGYVDSSELESRLDDMRKQWSEKIKQRANEYRTRKLKQRVDNAFAKDSNGDGKLNADEASAVIKISFAKVDSNGDGYLSRSEVESSLGLKKTSAKTIVETASAAGKFNTLIKAAIAANLADALQTQGPFTVFAPTDEAFAKIPKETIGALLKDKEKLKAVLSYHVVAGKVLSKDAVKLKQAKTLQGQNIQISVTKKGVKINNANLIATDILCSNGVIHMIDSVLLPKTSPQNDKVQPQVQPALFELKGEDVDKQWKTVNDGVMGGLSEGKVKFTDENTMQFYGNLSLRNNGGFASVRSIAKKLKLSEGDTVVVASARRRSTILPEPLCTDFADRILLSSTDPN